jgi:hypothetical protein
MSLALSRFRGVLDSFGLRFVSNNPVIWKFCTNRKEAQFTNHLHNWVQDSSAMQERSYGHYGHSSRTLKYLILWQSRR